jgi:hypothetical protein
MNYAEAFVKYISMYWSKILNRFDQSQFVLKGLLEFVLAVAKNFLGVFELS